MYLLSEGKEEADYGRIQETTKKLHDQLRQPERCFDMAATSPRMLPRAFNPTRLDVAPEHTASPPKVGHTPAGAPAWVLPGLPGWL